MSASLETTLLPPSALDEAAAIQGRTFFDDPLFEFVLPDEALRRAHLPWLMRVGIALGTRLGHVHTTSGAMLGHAVWLPPGETHLSDDRMAEAGFRDAETRIGASALGRFGAFMEQAAATHERLLPGPHWYLLILGVDLHVQGRGIGGSLIQPTLSRADADGLPCYLETAKERNLGFYRRHGFEVAEEQTIEAGGPTVWSMIRPPR
jgi:ribosomal protein S18 acetylase RimI-like enzyme